MKRLRRRIGSLVCGVLLLAGILWFLPTFFEPEFPVETLDISPARMSVPAADCYRDERFRVLLLALDGERREARFTWTPSDQGARVRPFGDDARIPALPEPGLMDKLFNLMRRVPKAALDSPALLFIAEPHLPGLPLPSRNQIGASRIYLGGVGPDGELRAVPFQADPMCCRELVRMGANITPLDFIAGLGPDCAVELRITRDGNRIQYRWGPNPWPGAEPRFSWGSADISAEEATKGRDEPLIPALAELLHRKSSSASPKIVFLETGTGVRYVDILRAVECGGGDSKVAFAKFPLRDMWGPQENQLRPPAGAESLLVEDLDISRLSPGFPLWVQFLDKGHVSIRGLRFDLEPFRERLAAVGGNAPVTFRGGRDTRWSEQVPFIQAAIDSDAKIYFQMAPLDPALRIGSAFHLPTPPPEESAQEIALVRVEGVLRPERAPVDGRSLRIRVPAGAKLEETLHALIALRQAGAMSFTFE